MKFPAPEPVVSVMAVLVACGWVSNANNHYSEARALKYNFGNFELSAAVVTNEYLRPVVSFSGLYCDIDVLREVTFDVPVRIASREQVLAWVAHGIGDRIPLAITPEWLQEGRSHRDQLPWEQHLAAYRRRPYASVAREWMRVLGKQLLAAAADATEDDLCRVRFDGEALRLLLPDKTLLVQAQGDAPWQADVIVRLADLRDLPKRWMHDPVGVAYWQDQLTIGNRAFTAGMESGVADDGLRS